MRTETLTVSESAGTRSDYPSNNYSGSTNYASTPRYVMFINLPMPSLTEHEYVTKMKLSLRTNAHRDWTAMYFYKVLGPWDWQTITHNNMPDKELFHTDPTEFSVSQFAWRSFEIPFVELPYGLAVNGDAPLAYSGWYGGGAGAGYRPYITYTIYNPGPRYWGLPT